MAFWLAGFVGYIIARPAQVEAFRHLRDSSFAAPAR